MDPNEDIDYWYWFCTDIHVCETTNQCIEPYINPALHLRLLFGFKIKQNVSYCLSLSRGILDLFSNAAHKFCTAFGFILQNHLV